MKNLILILMFAVPALGQSMSPLVVECPKHCKGSFTVSNNGIKPMAVVVEPLSFSLGPDGGSIFRLLDSGVDVNLPETSARVGPMQSHEFDYELHCGAPPCLVALRASMVIGHTTEGIEVRALIPHIAYLCDKARSCRANVRKAAGLNQ